MMGLSWGKQIQHSVNRVEKARVCAMQTKELFVHRVAVGKEKLREL